MPAHLQQSPVSSGGLIPTESYSGAQPASSSPEFSFEPQQSSPRRLLPVTALARILQNADPRITSWAVRKANEQGAIQPDVLGWFAGHQVHYYDARRIPELIRQLSQPDVWTPGTLVLHPQYGAGKIAGYPPGISGSSTPYSHRTVQFFRDSSATVIRTTELRKLVPACEMARRVGADRRSFLRAAERRGIFPDYIRPDGRIRKFYDESRTEAICRRWNSAETAERCNRGSVVVDSIGRPARVESRDTAGQAHLRKLDLTSERTAAPVESLQQLVSLRELARNEGMSRYRLQRLLRAAGIQPVHRGGKTLYYHPMQAHAALARLVDRERTAVGLRALATRTGISEALLAARIRRGVIRTLGGHDGAYTIPADEAARIESCIQAGRSLTASLQSQGICSLKARGRSGAEVVRWNLTRLLENASHMPADRRAVLFAQVSWLCEGAGEKRFREAMDAWLASFLHPAGSPDVRGAQLLLPLLDLMPEQAPRYRMRLSLLAAGHVGTYAGFEARLRRLAGLSGCADTARSAEHFREYVDGCLYELLTQKVAGGSVPVRPGAEQSDEALTTGAVVAWGRDLRPRIGWITSLKRDSWDAIAQSWDKTLTVRFPDEERSICCGAGRDPVQLLLRSSEARSIAALLDPYRYADRMAS